MTQTMPTLADLLPLLPELVLARTWELTTEEIARTVHAHPTLSEALMEAAHAVRMNAAATQKDRTEADRRYYEAKTQQDLLLQSSESMNSDFYTYRYLASQGFLPGYNFPRLPLMAFIPARKEKVGKDSFLTRPRFLGLAELGPRSIIYHEGSRYEVHKVILPVSATTEEGLTTQAAKLCPQSRVW